ncbi:MAG: extracellular solute-binding protein [Chloroflexi bacterium]|nr:extracellular solute-binding protein [Chloroflexota bacterium]
MPKIATILIISLITLSLILPACGSRPEPAATPTAPPTVAGKPVQSTRPAWEQEWETTLAAAQKEGELNFYTTYGADWRMAMTEAMKRKYGIAFNVLSGRSDELMERIWREQRSKIYVADATQAISGKRYFVEYQQLGTIFQNMEKALILPEALDPKAWVSNGIPWVDQESKNLLFWRDYLSVPVIVNSEQVGPQELRVWDDLLNPKWKGKIILSDPTIGGAASTVMSMLAWGIKDWDWIGRLLKQEPDIQRDYRLMTEWIARGKFAIMIGPSKEEAQRFMNAGAPMRYVNFEDGVITTFGAGTVAMLNGGPHPNATRVFVNFLMTKEGQEITARVGGYPSARVDVPTDFFEPEVLRRPGQKAYSTEARDYLQKFDDISARLKTMIDPLMRR